MVGATVPAFQRVVATAEARQKLIGLADRSELGWRVVQQYLADPIEDDADNEKRIKKSAAELKAAR
jgi:hypothetical protein